MRLRNKPWAKERINQFPEIVIPDAESRQGLWNQVFRNNHPIYVEVGTGKGQFLTEMGKCHSKYNFVGIEKYESVLLTAMERVVEAGLENVKLFTAMSMM